MAQRFNSIQCVVAEIREGKMVIVVDDPDRENEGDIIMAAQFITPDAVNFMVKHGRGLICAPTTSPFGDKAGRTWRCPLCGASAPSRRS